MSTNVNDAINTWNAEHAAATADLAVLEATLKTDFNKYVDSLAAYLTRLESANSVRSNYINVLEIEDVSNNPNSPGPWVSVGKASQFASGAEQPIENNAVKFLLDTINPVETKSPVIVRACDSVKLLTRKVV